MTVAGGPARQGALSRCAATPDVSDAPPVLLISTAQLTTRSPVKHLRELLQADALRQWAAAARAEAHRWDTIDGDEAARRRAVRRMRQYLRQRTANGGAIGA